MSIDAAALRGNWNYPTSVKFGCGRIAELADHCRALGMKRPLLITDPGLAGLPIIKDVTVRAAADSRAGLDRRALLVAGGVAIVWIVGLLCLVPLGAVTTTVPMSEAASTPMPASPPARQAPRCLRSVVHSPAGAGLAPRNCDS